MSKRNILLLFSTLLNAILVFVLVTQIRKPVVNELSDSENSIPNQFSNFENTGEVIGEVAEREELLVKVTKVIDGDTVVLESGQTLRYIGIDTPEVSQGKECYALESTEKNKELVLGKLVRLEKDVSERDRYGRLLRYAYVGDTFINETLVRDGFATASPYPPDVKYSELFKEAEKDARENNRGLWNHCAGELSEVSKVEQVPQVVQNGDWNYSNKFFKYFFFFYI